MKFCKRGVWSAGQALYFSAATVFIAGCGGVSDQPDLGTVTGTVTLDDKPLPNATVKFMPDSGRSSLGITDAAGHYELQYTNDVAGAKVGPHTISITTKSAAFSSEGGGGTDAAANPELVPVQYNAQSTLKEDVAAGENTIDFALKSGGATSAE